MLDLEVENLSLVITFARRQEQWYVMHLNHLLPITLYGVVLFAQSMINDTMVFPETKKVNSFSVN